MNKRLYIACLAVLSVALIPYCIVVYNNMGEDAFISFRYVRNLVEGKGLVYNEGEWVEGFSNFSWVMLLAIPTALGGDILLWSKLLAIAAHAGMIWLAGLFFLPGSACLRRNEQQPENKDSDNIASKTIHPVYLFAPLAIFLNPHLHYHTGRGLETTFYSMVFLVCLFALARARFAAASLTFALLALTRPEGILHFFGFAILLAAAIALKPRLSQWLAPPDELRWSSFIKFIAPGAAIIAAFLVWRFAVYDQLFPNTVYAKTAPLKFLQNPALAEIVAFLQASNGLPLLALLALIFTWRANPMTWQSACVATGVLAITVYMIIVGEVQAELFRHLIPLIAPMILILQAGLITLSRRPSPAMRPALILAAILLLALNFHTPNNGDHPASRLHVRTAQFLTRWDWAGRWEWFTHSPIHMFSEAGRWVEANLPPGSLLAADQMGQLGYYAPSHSIIDLLGLMDRHIAHHGLSWDYLSQRNPDYFIVYGENEMPYLSNVRALTETPEFLEHYRLKAILASHYPEKIANQFLVYERANNTEASGPTPLIRTGATAEEWEKYWRF